MLIFLLPVVKTSFIVAEGPRKKPMLFKEQRHLYEIAYMSCLQSGWWFGFLTTLVLALSSTQGHVGDEIKSSIHSSVVLFGAFMLKTAAWKRRQWERREQWRSFCVSLWSFWGLLYFFATVSSFMSHGSSLIDFPTRNVQSHFRTKALGHAYTPGVHSVILPRLRVNWDGKVASQKTNKQKKKN